MSPMFGYELGFMFCICCSQYPIIIFTHSKLSTFPMQFIIWFKWPVYTSVLDPMCLLSLNFFLVSRWISFAILQSPVFTSVILVSSLFMHTICCGAFFKFLCDR